MKLVFSDGRVLEAAAGARLLEVIKANALDPEKTILAAFAGNKIRELSYVLPDAAEQLDLELVGMGSLDGIRIYQRSASFVLIKALGELQPQARIRILHSVANGLYCEVKKGPPLTASFIKELEVKMREITAADLPFEREEVPVAEAIRVFKKSGSDDKARLLSYRPSDKASIYRLGGLANYFYGYLAPSTGYIKHFALSLYDNGFILQLPSLNSPNKVGPVRKNRKLYEVFKETLRWREILEVPDVSMLNEVINSKRFIEFVLISEAFHEKKIAQIADMITERGKTKVVLISGPSASGKTTFTKRLAIQLRINGRKPLLVSMDDYFLDRDKTPKDKKGAHNFETPLALNIEMFKDHMREIIAGREIELPRYDFKTGTNSMSGTKIIPGDQSVVLVEGIHGLNPVFTEDLPVESIFKIYVSALTEIPLDRHNRIPTADTRLLRRIIRDSQFRCYGAADTIARWPSVREGETKYVFSHQEEADVFFNTALIYEHAALKTIAEPVLRAVSPDTRAYAEALRLLKFLAYFLPVPVDVIPRHSILREFLGSSSFKY